MKRKAKVNAPPQPTRPESDPPIGGPGVDVARLPRVSARATVAMLKEECLVRGLVGRFHSMTKDQLLERLVDNTVMLCATNEYKALARIKDVMRAEAAVKEREAVAIVQERREVQDRKRQKRADDERAAEKRNQKQLHCHSLPAVHSCPLAISSSLALNGRPRSTTAVCNLRKFCCTTRPFRSCDECNFDVCQACADLAALPAAEQDARRAAHDRAVAERERQMRNLWAEQEREQQLSEDRKAAADRQLVAKLDASGAHIKNPPAANRNPQKLLAYVVWSSNGYDSDKFHGYNEPPEKEFDSTYASKEDANARATFLFYQKNIWGLSPQEMLDEDVDERTNDGCDYYEVRPEDSERWKVGVVPKAAFAFLNIRKRHHDDDMDIPDFELERNAFCF
ncbi:hypothetical protein HK405_015845 [Cladochytrium tenue]|nr:hypothetical protein HK405_015845 [Cladochytrium tenue]